MAAQRYVPPSRRRQQEEQGQGDGEPTEAQLQRRLADLALDAPEPSHARGRGRGQHHPHDKFAEFRDRPPRGPSRPAQPNRAEEEAKRTMEREMTLEWIVYDHDKDSIDNFLEGSRPSRLEYDEVVARHSGSTGLLRLLLEHRGRIGPGYTEPEIDAKELADDFEKLQKKGEAITDMDIDALARRHGCVAGKWLLFETDSTVDDTWRDIAKATLAGDLGTYARVAPAQPGSSHSKYVVQVYTKDYLDKEDVMRVRRKLEDLGARRELGYKPDIFTKLGIYSGNRWHLKPTVYHA